VTPHRPLSERERTLLMGWCGTDDDAVVLEARTLFNDTIVGIERGEERNASMIKACQTGVFLVNRRRGAKAFFRINSIAQYPEIALAPGEKILIAGSDWAQVLRVESFLAVLQERCTSRLRSPLPKCRTIRHILAVQSFNRFPLARAGYRLQVAV
jgi:hypothetical protein